MLQRIGRRALRSTQRAAIHAVDGECKAREVAWTHALPAAQAAVPCASSSISLGRRFVSSATPSSAASAASHTEEPDASIDPSIAALTTPPPAPLFVTTRHQVAGRVITHDLGLVAASAFRSRNLLIDVLVAVTRIFGGETPDYTVR
jgi:hypothetical protein